MFLLPAFFSSIEESHFLGRLSVSEFAGSICWEKIGNDRGAFH